MIFSTIIKASKIYKVDYKKYENSLPPREVSKYESYKHIVKDLPYFIKAGSRKRNVNYKYEGSISTGNMAKIPWVCIFDKDITESATQGYYIVFLFKEDMTGGYLSLNQGFTQFKDKYGDTEGRKKAKSSAKFYQRILQEEFSIDTGNIVLKASTSLGKGYEAGNICSMYFDFDTISDYSNDEPFISALELLKDYYQFIKEDIIDRSLNNDGTEVEFQEELQEGKVERLKNPGGVAIQGKGGGKSSQGWKRKRNRAYTALVDADFKCEVEPGHTTFISPKTNRQFMEAHHLIPMEQQSEFKYSLDISENIICLCPNCHRAFHNSIDKIKNELIKKFFKARKNSLTKREINIEENELLKYYKTTPNNV